MILDTNELYDSSLPVRASDSGRHGHSLHHVSGNPAANRRNLVFILADDPGRLGVNGLAACLSEDVS
jgi:hypothetical protein